MLRAHEGGQPSLELGDLRTHDEAPVVEDPLHAGIDLGLEVPVLRLHVVQLDGGVLHFVHVVHFFPIHSQAFAVIL